MNIKGHILAVDDDDRLRDLLKRYLTREGHDVTTAKDAASARKLMSTMSFDLVILDVMMPGEDGLSLLKSVRATTLLVASAVHPDDAPASTVVSARTQA